MKEGWDHVGYFIPTCHLFLFYFIISKTANIVIGDFTAISAIKSSCKALNREYVGPH
jgi:hypothetical protein